MISQTKPHADYLFERLERRAMLSSYSLTELSWIPSSGSGYQPIAIADTGLILVNSINKLSYVCTIAHKRAYAAPQYFTAFGINHSGELAGNVYSKYHAYAAVDLNGAIQAIPSVTVAQVDLGGDTSSELSVDSINDQGGVAGSISDYFPPPPHESLPGVNAALPATFDPGSGQANTLGFGTAAQLPVYINNAGLIAFDAGFGEYTATVYNSLTHTTESMGSFGLGGNSTCTGINQNGQVVGVWDNQSGFVYDSRNNSISFIYPMNGFEPSSINDDGVVIGTAGIPVMVARHHVAQQRAAMFVNGTEIDLNSLVKLPDHDVLTQAVAINDSGQILVSDATAQHPASHVYVLTPVATSASSTMPQAPASPDRGMMSAVPPPRVILTAGGAAKDVIALHSDGDSSWVVSIPSS